MKYKYTALLIFVFSGISLYSQVRVGLKFNPGVVSSRLETDSDTLDILGSYNALRFVGGITLEREFRDNYVISTGILFAPKSSGVRASGNVAEFRENLNLQYLVIPLSLKLYTNEIGLDKRVYFQLGTNAEVNVHDNLDQLDNSLILKTGILDASILLSGGVDFQVGTQTSLYAGLMYQRGLINQFRDTGNLNIKANIDFIGIDFGINF